VQAARPDEVDEGGDVAVLDAPVTLLARSTPRGVESLAERVQVDGGDLVAELDDRRGLPGPRSCPC
jgi:hypothetical protein